MRFPLWASGFRRFAIRAGLTLLGVALFCGYAMAPRLAFLPYVALVPWAVLYMEPRRPRVSPLYFLLAGIACFILCTKSTFRFGWFVPPLIAPFFVAAWILFPLLIRPIHRLALPRSITLPVVWVGVEWARLLLATGHFDLFALGYSQARFAPFVQIADLTGVYGISFLVAAVNGLLADAFFVLKAAAWRPRILLRERRIVVPAVVIAAAFCAVLGYGFLRLETARTTPGPRVALDPTDASAPEGSSDLTLRMQGMVLTVAQGQVEGQPGLTTSSVFLVDAAGTVRGRYDKQILSPFAEYVPHDHVVGVVSPPVQRAYRRLVRDTWGTTVTLTPGTHMTLFELPWNDGSLSFAALIGAESAYPALVAEAGRRGARFVVNVTSEGDAGGVLDEQLLRVCVLRAIENRVAFVRAGNTGISSVIDAQGRLQSALPGTVPLSQPGTTPYAASHDAFALLCVAVSLWLLARALLRGNPTMTSHPVPAGATI